ncbi:hypothetical protein L1987_18560 [Smallanthus sonchifolius]|uniref:Uncharacterized protein n=1 Tax=Smallanthus sonchifolius TaxID=185202 RepID=A0ACB9J0M7_9ASTR|nr:hypothetical protein L1987_18560 [Smallanthus sonchifolius]
MIISWRKKSVYRIGYVGVKFEVRLRISHKVRHLQPDSRVYQLLNEFNDTNWSLSRLQELLLTYVLLSTECDGDVSDSSEGSVSLPSNGSGCCSGDSPSVVTGNDDVMQMMCPLPIEGDTDGVTCLHCNV